MTFCSILAVCRHLEERTAFIIRALKRWHTAKILHGETTRKIIDIHNAVKTSNLTHNLQSWRSIVRCIQSRILRWDAHGA
jgi:hypothetical protein